MVGSTAATCAAISAATGTVGRMRELATSVSSSLAAQTHTLRDEFGQVMELVRGTG